MAAMVMPLDQVPVPLRNPYRASLQPTQQHADALASSAPSATAITPTPTVATTTATPTAAAPAAAAEAAAAAPSTDGARTQQQGSMPAETQPATTALPAACTQLPLVPVDRALGQQVVGAVMDAQV